MSDTVLYELQNDHAILTLNRPEKRNSINTEMLDRFHSLLDEIEGDDDIQIIVLRGANGIFCTGMDLEGVVTDDELSAEESPYMNLLKRFASIDKVVIAEVDGTVMAGGMGLVAASDLVFSTNRSTFNLSEALWGLLPAMVMPFLIRRVGFQSAYRLTLTTETINATEAKAIHLVDELGDDIQPRIQAMSRRLSRIHVETIGNLKAYFRKMWIVTAEMEKTAVAELARLTKDPRVVENITNFVESGEVPWE